MLKSLLQLQKDTDDDVLTAALAVAEAVHDEEKEQSVEDSEDKEGAVEKDMTEMLQNIDDAGEHANDATPQVSKEPKDARGQKKTWDENRVGKFLPVTGKNRFFPRKKPSRQK